MARTRDPSTTLPKPSANDEVADLAHTLEDMLGELGAARSETEAALARQREFVADASHELRTPLTSILANLELLETELKGEQAEIAESALRSSRRMRRLVADLLLLARADAGRQAPRRPRGPAVVAREAAAEAAPLAVEHQLALDAPDELWVDGVPDDLHRAALNLIENALAHTPSGHAGDGVGPRRGRQRLPRGLRPRPGRARGAARPGLRALRARRRRHRRRHGQRARAGDRARRGRGPRRRRSRSTTPRAAALASCCACPPRPRRSRLPSRWPR